ncbi:helix-turn-helix domain-containing protein [Enterocloster citroniae]|uniref:helix-turn-helix domain-containing protein n=1 Tax=Enterocloster citroniae TaxID=358743 RepID=UPI001899A56A|nr:helix-turn-helix domain-containing protein [Enterocloster citroniae]
MKKKVRTLMIGSYFLVLIVSMLIYLGVRHETGKRMQEVYIERQLAVMDQAVMGVDRELEAVRKFCLKLSQDPYVQLFSFAGPPMDKYDMENIVKLVGNIRQNYTADPAIEDIYIYYEKCGRIANGNSFYKLEDYYRQEWSYQGKSLGQWTEMLEAREHSGYLPVFVMQNGVRQGEYITYIHKFGSSRPGEASAIAVLLKKEWLDGQLKGISEEGRTVIHPDSRSDVVFSFGEADPMHGPDLDIPWTAEDGSSKQVTLAARQYLAARMQSKRTGWQYESLIPYEIIAGQMRQSTQPLLAGVVLYGLIGVPVCLFLALKSYEPIKRLAGHMETLEAGGNGDYDSELDYIYSGIASIHRKYQELEVKYGSTLQEYDAASAKLKKNRERIQEGILRQLIGGHWRDEKELKERLSGMDIVFPHDRFCVIIAQIEQFFIQGQNMDAKERALTLFILKNVSREFLEPVGRIYPVSGEMDKVYILANLSEKGYEQMQVSSYLAELLGQLKDYMLRSMEIHISIGAGTICSSTDELSHSYKKAKQALDYCFIAGKSSVIIYDAMIQEQRKPYHYDGKLEKNILNALAQKDSQLCSRLLDETYDEALKQKVTVNEGKQLLIFLTDLSMKAIARSCMDRTMEESCQDMVGDMLGCDTLPEAIPLMKELMERLCCEREGGDGESVLGISAVRFIRDNYWKTNFSLQMCADEFQVSPEHLSRTIKAETGRNFMEIVNQLRLEKAKYYLSRTDKKMEEIAELSGYGTAKSFFRSFKQSEGMTPGAWRKNGSGD